MKKRFFLFFIIALGVLFYFDTTSFSFLSDDFFYLSTPYLKETLIPNPEFYHYIPVFLTVIFLLKSFFGSNPIVFHVAAISLHIFNILLVYSLSQKLLGNIKQSLTAAIVYTYAFSHYEVVFWVTGISTSLMVFFYLLGFASYLIYGQNKKLRFYILYIASYAGALLSHEYAVSLPIACLIYRILKKPRLKREELTALLFPVAVTICFFAVRLATAKGGIVAYHPALPRVIASVLVSAVHLFIPFTPFLQKFPVVLLIVFFITVAALVARIAKNRLRLFLILWTLLTIAVFSVTSLPQARYYYLSFIPATLFFASYINNKSKKIMIGYLFIFLTSSIFFQTKQKIDWSHASQVTRDTLVFIQNNLQKLPTDKPIYAVNFPDSINGGRWPAYIWRNGLKEALEYSYRTKFFNIIYRVNNPGYKSVRNDPELSDFDRNLIENGGAEIIVFNESLFKLSL